MRKVLLSLVIVASGIACGKGDASTADVGEVDKKMLAILKDLHAVDAAVNNQYGSNRDSLYKVYRGQVFTIHKTTAEQFESQLVALRQNPALFKKTYEKAVEELSAAGAR